MTQMMNTICRDRRKIRQESAAKTSLWVSDLNDLCTAAFMDVEDTVLKWCGITRYHRVPVSGPTVCGVVELLASKLNHD